MSTTAFSTRARILQICSRTSISHRADEAECVGRVHLARCSFDMGWSPTASNVSSPCPLGYVVATLFNAACNDCSAVDGFPTAFAAPDEAVIRRLSRSIRFGLLPTLTSSSYSLHAVVNVASCLMKNGKLTEGKRIREIAN